MPRLKCYSCMRPEAYCLCSYTKAKETDTRFVILMHTMEFKREKSGTGRLTHLQLKNSEIIMGTDFSNNTRVNEILKNTENDCYILYPSKSAINLSSDNDSKIRLTKKGKSRIVFIIDGTWPCAKKMLKLSMNLHALPTISFNSNQRSIFKIKQQPLPECLSTIESTKIVLDLFNKHHIEKYDTSNFLAPFEKMIEQQIEFKKNPPPGSYRAQMQSIPEDKTRYKDPSKRNLFFSIKEI